MRARNIKPGFFKNEEIAEMQPEARLLFLGLWCLADREGRLENRPKRIRAEIFPFDSVNIEKLLDVITSHGFITQYEVEGNRYIQVVNFKKHQYPHPHESRSIIPPCNDNAGTCRVMPLVSPSDVMNPDVMNPDIRNPDIRPNDMGAVFESIWNEYPRRKGRKAAEAHFKASVKTQADINAIRLALKRYREECIGKELKYIQHGSTWFNNWRDHLESDIPIRREPVVMPRRAPEPEPEITHADLLEMHERTVKAMKRCHSGPECGLCLEVQENNASKEKLMTALGSMAKIIPKGLD